MNIFDTNMTIMERGFMAECVAFNAEYARLNAMYEMAELQIVPMIREAEYKVFSESGTAEDFYYMVSEASAEATGQQKGIFGRMIESIVNFFKKIANGFKRLIGMDVDDSNVKVRKDVINNADTLIKSSNGVRQGINEIKSGKITSAASTFKKIVIPAVAATAAAAGGFVIWKKSQVKKKAAEVEQAIGDLPASLESVKKMLGDNPDEPEEKVSMKDALKQRQQSLSGNNPNPSDNADKDNNAKQQDNSNGASAKEQKKPSGIKNAIQAAKKFITDKLHAFINCLSKIRSQFASWLAGKNSDSEGELENTDTADEKQPKYKLSNKKFKSVPKGNKDAQPIDPFTDANDTEVGKSIRGEDNESSGVKNFIIKYKTKKGKIFYNDTETGEWTMEDKNGNRVKTKNKPDIKSSSIVDKVLKESNDIDEIRERLGEGYIVESTNYGINIIELPDKTDLIVNSVFGYDLDNESNFSESSGFEAELAELSSIFENL